MRVPLLRTPRGQASLALAGVLMIAWMAAYETYVGAGERARDRAALALVERQVAHAHALIDGPRPAAPQLRLSQLAAADANLAHLAALAALEPRDDGPARASLGAVRDAWATFSAGAAASATAPGAGDRAALQRAAGLAPLLARLDALAAVYRARIVANTQYYAGREALALAATAPLLAWALFVIRRGGAQQASATLAEPAVAADGPAPAAPLGPAAGLAADLPPRAAQRPRALIGDRAAGPRAQGGLAGELRLYVADFRQLAGIAVELALDERAAEAVPPALQPQALTIVREALCNTRRHSGATRVDVALWQEAGNIWLAVADNGSVDGPGGPPSAEQLELAITRARAERAGGELRVSARPGDGTLVMARLPIGEPAGEPFAAQVGRSPHRAW